MYSMTGYGKAEFLSDDVSLLVEIKTVNNRNFDLNIKTPRSFLSFDDMIRKIVQSYVKRGRIDIFITFIDKRQFETTLDINVDKAVAYYNAGKEIADKLGLENDITVSGIMRAPDVISDNVLSDVSEFKDVLSDAVTAACENLNKMRRIEGDKLIEDMLLRIDMVSDLRKKIIVRAPLVAREYKEKLKARIEEALVEVKYDESKLLAEVAFFADRVNIDEELTRLGSHISQFKDIIRTEGAGKKLDFLMQEFNRETNTICSKSNDIEVTKYALSLKNEIEKIREQVQNLE